MSADDLPTTRYISREQKEGKEHGRLRTPKSAQSLTETIESIVCQSIFVCFEFKACILDVSVIEF